MKSSYFMFVAGLVVMAWGVTGIGDGMAGIVGFAVGFVLVAAGTVLHAKEALKDEPTGEKNKERDTPALIRMTGVSIALLSLIMPYYNQPVSGDMQGLSMSFMEMLAAAYAGMSVEISYLFVLLVSVVVIGAFVSIFHHFGGYIMLLASMTVVFVGMSGVGSIGAMQYQVEAGLVLMVLAALVVISSALSRPNTGFGEDSDWAMASLVS